MNWNWIQLASEELFQWHLVFKPWIRPGFWHTHFLVWSLFSQCHSFLFFFLAEWAGRDETLTDHHVASSLAAGEETLIIFINSKSVYFLLKQIISFRKLDVNSMCVCVWGSYSFYLLWQVVCFLFCFSSCVQLLFLRKDDIDLIRSVGAQRMCWDDSQLLPHQIWSQHLQDWLGYSHSCMTCSLKLGNSLFYCWNLWKMKQDMMRFHSVDWGQRMDGCRHQPQRARSAPVHGGTWQAAGWWSGAADVEGCDWPSSAEDKLSEPGCLDSWKQLLLVFVSEVVLLVFSARSSLILTTHG